MPALRKLLDDLGRRFGHGGPLEKFFPAYDGVDTFLYTPAYVAGDGTHVRDALDQKRLMISVVLALVPCILMAMFNTGYQAHRVVAAGGTLLDTWQSTVFGWTGLAPDPASLVANLVHGALYFLPVLAVTFFVGGNLEVLFAVVRRHEINEGFLVTGMLIPLIVPATIPLWQVALGTAFGVVIGKEIFGGTGMNFLNPALVTRAFLFFAYPAQISGEVWVAATPPDGTSGATWLASYAEGSGHLAGFTWTDAFLGLIPGSMGETSVLAILLGGAFLVVTRIASWRIIAGVVGGTAVTAYLLNAIGS